MIVSHWDRTVAPYAKWIGFSAGMFEFKILMMDLITIETIRKFFEMKYSFIFQ